MTKLIATRLTEYQLGQADAYPCVELAPDVVGVFPEFLDDPRVDVRMYVVAVSGWHLDFVRVMAAPAPHPAPTIAALRRAARRAA
jgi:hypothetical protein